MKFRAAVDQRALEDVNGITVALDVTKSGAFAEAGFIKVGMKARAQQSPPGFGHLVIERLHGRDDAGG